MVSIEITDDQHDRITALREALADTHAGSYTSVTLPDAVAYLLDLADAVDDPDRDATITATDTDDDHSFQRAQLEAQLAERNRRHSDADPEAPMDLYTIAAEYNISGRSNMTKQELITAILDATESRYTDPFAPVDVDFPANTGRTAATADDRDPDTNRAGDAANSSDADGGDGGDAGDDSQLNAMLSLLKTHSDKWQPADGDARYEVTLPDGTVVSARTKDDVRATLFKHY